MLWVARGRDGVAFHHGKPEWHDVDNAWNVKTYLCALPRDLFPDLPICECRELRMVEPVDEAKERERFERAFGIVYPLHRNGLGDYMNTPTACVWQGWLAAKRAREGWVMTDQTDLRKLLNKMTKPQLVARCEELEDRDTRRHIECSRLRQELELRQDQIRILRAQIDAIDAGFVDALHGFIGDERVRPLIEGLLGT